MNRLSARNKLLTALAVILFFSFAGVSFLNYKITRASIRKEILRNDLPLTMSNIYSELSADLTRPLLVASAMSSDAFLKDWVLEGEVDPAKITRYLVQLKEKYGFFTTFFVSATTARYYRFSGMHKNISPENEHDIWYYNFLASGKEYDFDVDSDETAGNALTVFINYRVVDGNGRLLGVAGVGLNVDNVSRRITEYQKKYDRIVYLTDTQGIIQVHPDKTLIEKKKISELAGMADLAQAILKKSNDSANFEFYRNDRHILLTVRYLSSLDWFLYVEQDEAKSLAIARKNFVHTVLIGLMASVVIIILALVTINRYQEQLEAIAMSDELTGTANRRALELGFRRILYDHSRTGRSFSLLLLDLDGFKKVNDIHGHIIGDRFLVELVAYIVGSIRPTDILARWGGDEFVILTNSAGKEAGAVAERIRHTVKNAELAGPEEMPDDPRNLVTVSIGLSTYIDGDDLDTMLYRADLAMYTCKARNGDSVAIAV